MSESQDQLDLKSDNALDIATLFLVHLDKRKVDPVTAYAALGCAFQMLHQGLGKDKKEWLETTREMGELTDWEKDDT